MTLLMAPSINPFVGPRSVRSGEPLHGRERELDELRDSLIADRVVLLFSPSGAGKSSLLDAGLRHELEQERYADRFFVAPTIRINQEAPGNRYVTSALRSLAEATDRGVDDDALSTRTLDEFVGDELSAIAGRRRVVLIFDQFEEVFTLDPVDVEAKREFFDQIGTMLRNRRVWAVIAMRDDYVGHLEPHLAVFPTRLSTRLRLDFLDERAALAAVQRPVSTVGVEFTDEAARLLVSDLRTVTVTRGGEQRKEPGPYVEPVQLQVVCSQLWNRLPVGTATITADDVRRFANTDNALGDFYADQVAEVARKTGVPERRIRDWFETRLVTPQRFRSQEFEFPGTSGSAVLLALENCYLVRAETRRNVKWFELTHDRMIEPVLESNALWRSERLTPLQRLAADWDAGGRPPGMLVTTDVLADAQAWLASASASASDVTDSEREFVQESQRVQDEADAERAAKDAEVHRARRRLASVAALTVMSVVATVAIVAALILSNRAASDSRAADKAESEAAAANATATKEKAAAAASQADAEAATVKADATTQLADALTFSGKSRDENDPTDSLVFAIEGRRLSDGLATAAAWTAALARFGRSPLRPSAPSVTTGEGQGVGVAWSPDGAIAVANSDGTVGLIPAGGSSPSGSAETGDDDTTSVAWSSDGEHIATTNGDGTLTLFDSTLAKVAQLGFDESSLNDVAFSPDGTRLATISADRTVRLFGVAQLRGADPATAVLLSVPLPPVVPESRSDLGWSVTWSARGVIAAATYEGRMWLLDPARLPVAPSDPAGQSVGWAAAWSPAGDELAVIDPSGRLKLYDESLTLTQSGPSTGDGAGLAVHWSTDGQQLVTGNDDGTVRVFDTSLESLGDPVAVTTRTVYDVAWNAAGDEVGAVSSDGGLYRYQFVPLDRFAPSGQIQGTDVAVAPDGRAIALSDSSGGVAFGDTARPGPLSGPLQVDLLPVFVDWSDDGRVVAVGQNLTIQIVDPATRVAVQTATTPVGAWAVEWSPDSSTVATANNDGTVTLFDSDSLAPRTIGDTGTSPNYDVSWSADGSKVATVSGDRLVRVYDLTTGRVTPVGTGAGQQYGWAVAWSPDGTRIAELDRDGTVTLFDVATMTAIDSESVGGGAASAITWAPDGRAVVVADSAGSLRYLAAGNRLDIVATVRIPIGAVAVEWVGGDEGEKVVIGLANGSVQLVSSTREAAVCAYTRSVLTASHLSALLGVADAGCDAGGFPETPQLPLSLRRLPGDGTDGIGG